MNLENVFEEFLKEVSQNEWHTIIHYRMIVESPYTVWGFHSNSYHNYIDEPTEKFYIGPVVEIKEENWPNVKESIALRGFKYGMIRLMSIYKNYTFRKDIHHYWHTTIKHIMDSEFRDIHYPNNLIVPKDLENARNSMAHEEMPQINKLPLNEQTIKDLHRGITEMGAFLTYRFAQKTNMTFDPNHTSGVNPSEESWSKMMDFFKQHAPESIKPSQTY